MTRSISIEVVGLPAAQGSKRHVGNGIMVESSKAVKPWRQDVVAAARQVIDAAGHETFRGPVTVSAQFWFPRPKHHFGTGKNASVLKASAPDVVAKKPDLDKVLRSTFDALVTAGVIGDDSLVVEVMATKRFGHIPGAQLIVSEMQP